MQKVFYDNELYKSKPTFIDSRIKRAFTFGIANGPIVLSASASARDQAYLASLRRIDQAEAVRLMAARLTAKATLATRDACEAKILFFELSGWRCRSGDLLNEPAVQAALDEALAALTSAQARPARLEPVDTIATLKTQMAAMAARLNAIESEQRP